MNGNIKAFGRMPRAGAKPMHDARDRVGKIVLTAEDETDAALLALIYRYMFAVGTKKKDGNRIHLYAFLRDQMDYLDEMLPWKEAADKLQKRKVKQ